MTTIKKLYSDLPTLKQRLVRNKWLVDFKIKSPNTFWHRLEKPTLEDVKYFSVVFNCPVEQLLEESEVTRKARPIEKLVADQEQTYGLTK